MSKIKNKRINIEFVPNELEPHNIWDRDEYPLENKIIWSNKIYQSPSYAYYCFKNDCWVTIGGKSCDKPEIEKIYQKYLREEKLKRITVDQLI